MAVEVKVGSLGLSSKVGIITRWYKRERETVKKGEVLAEIETQKTTFEIFAPASGMLLIIFYAEKTLVKAKQTIGLIGAPDEDISAYLEDRL
jgi:pyruvate dehydrogenase E2 component (dihydrolipoamide acetyltransferase)